MKLNDPSLFREAAFLAGEWVPAAGEVQEILNPANGQLVGREHRLRVASAQVKSAILLAGLQAQIGLCALPVDADLAGAQQLLQTAVSDRREAPAEPPVEAQLRLVRPDLAGLDARHAQPSQRIR